MNISQAIHSFDFLFAHNLQVWQPPLHILIGMIDAQLNKKTSINLKSSVVNIRFERLFA